MKIQILTPTLAGGEYVALPCVTPTPAPDGRGIVARGADGGTDVLTAGVRRMRPTGKHTGFAHRARFLSWSPPI